jgi:hypothetical protein
MFGTDWTFQEDSFLREIRSSEEKWRIICPMRTKRNPNDFPGMCFEYISSTGRFQSLKTSHGKTQEKP